MSQRRIRVGISGCLLGQGVRFDGGHKHDRFLDGLLSEYVDWVPVCPEVEAGMGIPRETIRLIGDGNTVRAQGNRSGIDHTGALREHAETRVPALALENLTGFVLKQGSPSCGMERVKVYDKNSVPSKTGVGVFAGELLRQFPNLPIEEEGRLRDARIRESFVMRLFCYDRWRSFRAADPSVHDLVQFHTRHKMILLAYDPQGYRELGRFVAHAARLDSTERLDRYETLFMKALSGRPTAGKHTNVLEHLAGYLKSSLDSSERSELHSVIQDYRRGWIPLIAPLMLLRHHLRSLGHAWIDAQIYLDPYPKPIGLWSAL